MLKKIVIGGALAALVGTFVLGGGVWSYVRTAGGWAEKTAKNSIPLEWEIQRAHQMIADLDPEIAENARRIAHEKIKVARLEKELSENQQQLADAREDIHRLKGDLQGGDQVFVYSGKTYTSAQVRDDLSRRFDRFKTREETAHKLDQMLAARQGTLQAATERMEAMLSAKRQLEVEIENLQARLAAVRVAQTSSQLALDDSALSRTRALLDDIAARIDVEEEVTQVDAEYFGGIDLDEPSDGELLDEITAYFEPAGEASEAQALTTVEVQR